MKSKFASFIMTIIMITIIVILILFGAILYQDVTGNDPSEQVQNFISTYIPISDGDTENKDKLTTPEIIGEKLNQIPSTPSKNNSGVTTTDYNKIQVNKYFYEQLEDYSKIIYKSFEANKEQMKSGNAQIELGTTFSELLEQENGEKLLGEYYQSAVECYLYDNPDVFYISANKLYLNIETTTRKNKKTYNVFINNGSQPNYFSNNYTSEEQVRQAIEEVQSIKNRIISQSIGKPYYDIKMVHDYLVENIEYDTTISKNNIYNIYGALVNNSAVCEGYAKAFKYLLDELQIPCVLVIGSATNSAGERENHAWNYVQLDGSWYAVDTTWDDPVIIGNGKISNATKYKYFLKGNVDIEKDHVSNGQFTENGRTYIYPTLSLYNYK